MARFALNSMAAAVAGLGLVNGANAFEIDTGNTDVKLRWDNSVRYNAGWRMEGIDSRLHTPTNGVYGVGDAQANRGDLVINRGDLVSELDMIYKGESGLRISAALWGDSVNGGGPKKLTAAEQATCAMYMTGCRYPSFTKRFTSGPSAEFLDAFVFTSFNLGDTYTSVKLGRHNVYWGESFYASHVSVANGQAGLDGLKAVMSPGIEAKEVFMPQNQLTFTSQVSKEFSIAGQYSMEWRANRLAEAGTWFDTAVTAYYGVNAPFIHDPVNEPKHNGGDWGLMARWTPAALDGSTMGVYYREFYPKQGTPAYFTGGVDPLTFANTLQSGMGYSVEKIKLLGLSYSTVWAGANWAFEATHQRNLPLYATVTGPAAAKIIGTAAAAGTAMYMGGVGSEITSAMASTVTGGNMPLGNVTGFLVNGVYLLPKTALWEAGALVGELYYQHLDSVTVNPMMNIVGTVVAPPGLGPLPFGTNVPIQSNIPMFMLNGNPYCTSVADGCATRDSWGLNVSFTPQWLQALPGMDLSLPIFLGVGLKGNSATGWNLSEGGYNYSIGLQAELYQKHTFKLTYSDSYQKMHDNPALAALGVPTVSGPNGFSKNNHAWLGFSYKTAF